LLGCLAAAVWLALFVVVVVRSVLRAGSLRAWLRGHARRPVASLAGALMLGGAVALLLSLLTDGGVPLRLALMGPIGAIAFAVSRSVSRR